MKLKGIALVLLVAAMLTVSVASAECEPCPPPPCPPPPCEEGKSPGYWKAQCKAYVTGKGALKEDVYSLTFLIEQVPDGDVEWAYDFFKTGNNADGSWTWLANLFNTAAGYGQYNG